MKALKRNYHWVIALIVFAEMIIYGGYVNACSVFTVPITEALSLSRGSYALAVSTRGIVGFVSSLLTGFAISRYGYRKCAIFGLLTFCAGLILLAFSNSLVMISLANGVLGVSCGVCTTAGAVQIVKNWFYKHQGLILGLVTMATGLGGSVLSMGLTGIIVASSWRYAYCFIALLIAFLALLYLLVRDRPEQMGLRPYGLETLAVQKKTAAPANTEWAGLTLAENLRKPQFYLMVLGIFLSCFCAYLTFNVVSPHFQDSGFSPSDAALYQSILLLCLSVAKLVGGWLSDRIGPKRVTILSAICAGVGQYLLADVSNLPLCCIGIVLFSFGLLPLTITAPLLTMPLFGYRSYGTMTGIFLAMVSLANMLAAPVVNLFYDLLGSYSPVFRVAALVDIALIGLYLLIFFLCEREKKRFLAVQPQQKKNGG